MSIVRVNEFTAAVGKSAELFDFLQTLVPYITGAAGCIACELFKHHEHSDQFMIIEDREKHKDKEPFAQPIIKDGLMAPPSGEIDLNNIDTLGAWHWELEHRFEIGTLFTIIAGVLNLLAVYDAFAGPAILRDDKKKKRKSKRESLI